MNNRVNKMFVGNNEHNLIVLPVIVGLVMTIISYLLGDMENNQYMTISSLPMLIGACMSGILSFNSAKKSQFDKKLILIISIGAIIGVYPLIMMLLFILK